MATPPKWVYLWQHDQVLHLLRNLRVAPGTAEYSDYSNLETPLPLNDNDTPVLPRLPPDEAQCMFCQVTFEGRDDQVAHYKLDWHRKNMQRSLKGKSVLTEEQFLNDISDVSSISGSESDDDSAADADEITLGRQPQIFFVNAEKNIVSLVRTVLISNKNQLSGEEELVQHAMSSPQKLYWVILLLGGGHFAGAVFKGAEVVIHKTFHSYTVRAKQGGSQGNRDSRSGTSHPKSSGASLRRYNEQSYAQHINELLETWKHHLQKCDLIFIRAPGQNRNKLLFSGQSLSLSSTDSRVRSIPFTTRRATFAEVVRVHYLLSRVQIYGNETEFEEWVKSQSKFESSKSDIQQRKKEKSPEMKPHETTNSLLKSDRKSKQVLSRKADPHHMPRGNTKGDVSLSSVGNLQLESGLQQMGLECDADDVHLQDGVKQLPRSKRKKKREEEIQSSQRVDTPRHVREVHSYLYTACKTGNTENLEFMARVITEGTASVSADCLPANILEAVSALELPLQFKDVRFSSSQKTMLHIASENGHKDLVWWLMDHGCDPADQDGKGQTPYNVAANRHVRNHFRLYVSKNPSKYDYQKALIPGPLTEEELSDINSHISGKRKAQKLIKQKREIEKKQRAKQSKEEEEMQRVEEEEKMRFLNLSDREKRALAAERRLLQQNASSQKPLPVLSRCFQCGKDITGEVPFEYADFKFCSTACVREHRKKNQS